VNIDVARSRLLLQARQRSGSAGGVSRRGQWAREEGSCGRAPARVAIAPATLYGCRCQRDSDHPIILRSGPNEPPVMSMAARVPQEAVIVAYRSP